MGIFDYFSKENRQLRHVEKLVRRANNKHTPKDYRQIALGEMINMAKDGNEIALRGLISRFSVNAEPSIEDEREKEWASEALIEIGDLALPYISKTLRSAESINWVQRTLKNIVEPEQYKKELLDVLSDFDTEYERNPDRKIQIIMALADVKEADVAESLIRFLQDVNETVRYQTVTSLMRLENEMAREPLLETMTGDESIRIRNLVFEGFATLGWLTTGYKKKVDAALPEGYKHDKSGKIIKLGAQS